MPENHVHLIAGLTLLSRIADLWTTYLVTPNLELEANSLVRRFRWKFACFTLAVALIPYWFEPAGVIIFTASLLIASSNATKVMAARALGEKELAAIQRRVILATPPWPGLIFMVLPGILVGILGLIMLLFYPDGNHWGFYFANGFLAYAIAIFVWYPKTYFRIRAAAKSDAQQSKARES